MSDTSCQPTVATTSPLAILSKEGCKVQSLTVSDQHATLLLCHQESIEEDTNTNNSDDEHAVDTTTTTTITSLLKLTIVPFHKEILGSNPVLCPEDVERGQLPERNLLVHDPKRSEEIISFLKEYRYALKSESGAEYSYYDATPSNIGRAVEGKDNSTTIDTAISKLGTFDIELISPANAYQINRAMPTLGHILINETPELYNTVVKPYIQSIVDSGSLSWIQNVIEEKKEKERLLVSCPKFVINIDTKWRSHPPPLTTPRKEWYKHPATEDLYCLGIVKQYDISCLRDLRKKHIPMLQEMVKEGLDAIKSTYGINSNQIRIFVHYQPQFYHFHVHFTRLENEIGCCVERGHLISDIIQNLEMDNEYYCKRNITYKLKKGSPLENLIENYYHSKKKEE